jgi:hypothetical protein
MGLKIYKVKRKRKTKETMEWFRPVQASRSTMRVYVDKNGMGQGVSRMGKQEINTSCLENSKGTDYL